MIVSDVIAGVETLIEKFLQHNKLEMVLIRRVLLNPRLKSGYGVRYWTSYVALLLIVA
jgi:hypothetical protein